jgi:hypothetical protein
MALPLVRPWFLPWFLTCQPGRNLRVNRGGNWGVEEGWGKAEDSSDQLPQPRTTPKLLNRNNTDSIKINPHEAKAGLIRIHPNDTRMEPVKTCYLDEWMGMATGRANRLPYQMGYLLSYHS